MGVLDGQAVVITGAGQGLGAAYAVAVADSGAAVVVNDVKPETAEEVSEKIRAAGGVAVVELGDITDPARAEALINRCVNEFGAITGLVNNAGLYEHKSFQESNVDTLRKFLEVNVVGTYNCAHAALEPMLRQGGGSILNVTSGAHVGMPGTSLYGATKGAVASFTYAWAAELRESGVRVNAISPMAATPMSEFSPHLPPPENNVQVAVYLLSDRGKTVTGQILRINGRYLSLMCHPANRAPVLERDGWSYDAVAAAFDTVLADLQVPTGLVTYEISAIT